ncbi:hypothetical protein OKA04_02865 [Luteolibacter flavescens]|uniref:Uncharacterized protein n=1 Tax=Luteolibacter flavescens TaxID=1859460 RepID=A0ABT3FJA7_9BACT|nr:hypothetical protein [Luteolibacter flavescens]MCW1883653.1 hypothetical protein [Luteolibacter flavescens]
MRSIVGAVFLTAGVCFAGEPTHNLSKESAVKLINLLIEDHQERIQIVMISEGSKVTRGLEEKNVRRVMAIHPVPEEGRRVRRVQTYDFHWNDEYGWHCWEKREERGVDVVYIYSELQGEVVVK